MYDLEELLAEKRRKQAINDAAKTAALSGAGSGAVIGGVTSILSGAKNYRDVLKRAAVTALGGGALAGGGTKLGSELMGVPDRDDMSGYATRAGLGAGVGGALLGGGLGAVLGSRLLSRSSLAKKLVPQVAEHSGAFGDNLIGRTLDKFTSMGGKEGAVRGGLLGAAGGGLFGAYQGADEGMQVDFIQAQLDRKRRERMREAMGDV
jgi:hypothetical protein